MLNYHILPSARIPGKDGYVAVWCSDRKKRLLHRALIELALGRTLARTEIVHHLNGIKHDNRIENLQLVESQRAHLALHQLATWTRKYPCCVECGTTERKHGGKGKCVNCYMRSRR